MKHRLIVVSGQRILQIQETAEWTTIKVGRAGSLPSGVYDIFAATEACQGEVYRGLIVHCDDRWVYQLVGRKYLKHRREQFTALPLVGTSVSVTCTSESAQ